MRQTNIIWINFIVALSILRGEPKVTGMLHLLLKVIRELPRIIVNYWWALVLDLAFVAFLVINKGSIVLGHQEHHSFSLNLSQMCYLALFLSMFPVGAFSIRDVLASAKTVLDNYNTRRRYSWLFILLCGLNVLVTQFYSIRHPFLDSDNRHYGQKFYKYVISTNRRTWLAPLYTFCLFFIYELLKSR